MNWDNLLAECVEEQRFNDTKAIAEISEATGLDIISLAEGFKMFEKHVFSP